MKQTIPVVGMACSACSANIERRLNDLKGVRSAAVSLAGRTALVDFDEREISLADMKREINSIGYDLVIEANRSAEAIQKREYIVLRRRMLLSWVLSILGMLYQSGGYAVSIGQYGVLWQNVLCVSG